MRKRLLALMLAIIMIVAVLPVASAAEVYTDVESSAWYYDNVQYVSRNGLMTGTGENVFSPDAPATRAMVMTILARTAGVDTGWSNPWYAAGLNWAVVNSISDGTDPMGNITREQLAAILYRYAKQLGCNMNYWQPLNIFTDADQVSDWAVEALEWAVAVGLLEGANDALMPKANTTRAQLAAVLNRYCENVLNYSDVGDGSQAVILWPLWSLFFGKDEEAELPEGMPVAIVTDEDQYENTDIDWGSFAGFTPSNSEQQLESAYKFTAPHDTDTIEECEYKDWYADFYVSIDRDASAGTIFLGGNYGSFGWVGFESPIDVAANEEVPLLGSVAPLEWTYEMVASFVGEFICGVSHLDDSLNGATFTVKLRLTNPEDLSEYYDVNTVKYTFDNTPAIAGS